MKRKPLIPVRGRSEIPHFENDNEFAAFWDTHEVSEELLSEASIPRKQGPAARLAKMREATPDTDASADRKRPASPLPN